MLKLTELLEYAENLKDDESAKVSLYFVQRHLKPGVKATDKVGDKYNFSLKKAVMSDEVSKYFREVLSNQIISHASKDEVDFKKYTVIDDDLGNKIYTYALNNATTFHKLINEDIRSEDIPTLDKLSDIKKSLWAYCLKVEKDKKYTYSFRKLGKARLTTTEPQTTYQHMSAWFDGTGNKLRPFDGNMISFDDKIDCIYINDNFYVFHKKQFESIVGLEEEFKEEASRTLQIIKKSNLVEGLDIIEEAIVHKPSLRKTLTTIAEKGNHNTLATDGTDTLNEILVKFEDREFKKTDDGKILLENQDDVKHFLRLLNDYYKQGLTTRKYYGTDSGNIISLPSK